MNRHEKADEKRTRENVGKEIKNFFGRWKVTLPPFVEKILYVALFQSKEHGHTHTRNS